MDATHLDARSAWNTGADAYITFVESGADYYRHLVHGPGLLAACGEVRDLSALDLGCGHGYFSRLLASQGAKVTGVDLADDLIAYAQARELQDPQGITYFQMDAARVGGTLTGQAFDLVTGCMSFQDMHDIESVLSGIRTLIKPDGRVVFSIPHPCTDPPHREWKRDWQGHKLALCLDRYFESGKAVCDWSMARLKYQWKTPFHRYTLTEWSTLIREAGFVIQALHEPRPDPQQIAAHPDLEDCARMPYFLIFDLRPSPAFPLADLPAQSETDSEQDR